MSVTLNVNITHLTESSILQRLLCHVSPCHCPSSDPQAPSDHHRTHGVNGSAAFQALHSTIFNAELYPLKGQGRAVHFASLTISNRTSVRPSLRPDREWTDGMFETAPACQAWTEHLIPSFLRSRPR
jgi:hypothetical protein